MRIASPVARTAAAPARVQPSSVAETVSPSRLFGIARARLEAALGTLGAGGPESMPGAVLTVLAINQAEAGVQTLRSVLVPATPFDFRSRAATAVDRSRRAVDALRSYHEQVLPLGDGPLDPALVHDGPRVLLESARELLRSVVGTLR